MAEQLITQAFKNKESEKLNFVFTTYKIVCLPLCVLVLGVGVVQGQNIESIGKEKPVKISGGLAANQIFYASQNLAARRDPYSYYLTGSLNFSLYGWNVPLSFSLSNQNFSYQQPFNQYGLHPTYKWVTGHIGYHNMTFSPYTLSGHVYRGVGVDLSPNDKIKISAMYGRLQRPVEPDSADDKSQAAFRRMGYGVKGSYTHKGNLLELVVFRAKDELHSIAYVPENVLPQENLVISIGGAVSLAQKVQLKAEMANSAITRDIRTEEVKSRAVFDDVGSLFTPRLATSYYKAFKSSISYQEQSYAVGVGYERIDPEYRTLGTYFFSNDLENITVNGATAFMQGKINVSANVGTQRDNLDNSKISTMRRLVTAVTLGFVPGEKLNLTASYSNFQTFTNIRSQFVNLNQLTPFDNLDTLNFTQISQNLTLNGSYLLPGHTKKRQRINASLSVMKAADEQGGVPQNSGTTFYNGNGAYSLSVVPRNLTISASFNVSQSKSITTRSSTLGPSLTVSKSLLDKKLKLSGGLSANDTYAEGNRLNRISSLRNTVGYSIKQKHNFSLNAVLLHRHVRQEQASESFLEFTSTLGYNYAFGK